MYVCLCKGLTESTVRELGANGVTRPREIVSALGLNGGDCCRRCIQNVQRFVALTEQGQIAALACHLVA